MIELTCCGSVIEPEWFTHEDGTRRGQWRCPQCRLTAAAKEDTASPVFARIAEAGLQSAPLFVFEQAVTLGLAR